MRTRRVVTAALLGLLTFPLALTATPAAANPSPIPPIAETLVSEGITVEGPLVNGVVLPHLL
ncbi:MULTISPECIES: hypothetical protein [Streptomyces]|uniref:Uncharacterized protein n=1 Tax=Streptomyces huasconensis TaxID=1854574 RepID=A0ABV3M7E8_9ACTN|nr:MULTISPECIES: hypothetical protein [Streptomyces]UFQ18613.1 hypothetical protein J2N69_28525 [Streptomyces huasconensis]WCL88228.1 hypothetical protein PPN52_28510 [Streptomyces sp. JCM 35825]